MGRTMWLGSAVILLVELESASAQVPAGKATYERLCVSCHGADGAGNPEKAKALKIDAALLNFGRPEVVGLSREERRKIVLTGKDKMPAYAKKLKPHEIDPVLDYSIELARKLCAPK